MSTFAEDLSGEKRQRRDLDRVGQEHQEDQDPVCGEEQRLQVGDGIFLIEVES